MQKLNSAIVIAVIVILGTFFLVKYNKGGWVLYGDAMGYYMYLPATFIYHSLQDMDQLPKDKNLGYGTYSYADEMKKASLALGQQHWVNQYTYAVAVMELPFFLCAHTYEKIRGLPADGYSNTYNMAVIISGLFYSLLGLLLLYKILRYYFNPFHSLLGLSLVLLGTNMFWFTFRQAGMSHIPLFFLYALLAYITIRVHQQPKRISFIILGLVAGLITIMRPTDIVCLLIPFLYGVYNKETFLRKAGFIKTHFASIILAAIAFCIPVIPQLLYWNMLTGHHLYYSYGNQLFFWDKPKIIEGLFYFSNGWFPYAPVMVFAILGLLLYRSFKPWITVLIIMLPVYIYIIYSWYCYNYINGLGSRPMLHLYPLLALPLTACIQYVAKKGIFVKAVFSACCLFSIAVIFSLSLLKAQDKFNSDNASFQFYWTMLFKTRLTYLDLVTKDLAEFQPDEKKLKKICTLAEKNFNQPVNEHYVPDPADSTGFVYHVLEGEEYFPDPIKLPYKKEQFMDAKWIKCSARFMYPDYLGGQSFFLVFCVKDKTGNLTTWKGCKIENKIGIPDSSCPHAYEDLRLEHYEYWKWSTIYFYTKVPDNLAYNDTLVLDIWNMSRKQIFFDDFKIELYK